MHLDTVHGTATRLSPRTLTRHAVCLGMTGSGKIGPSVALLENLALVGIPLLCVDPKSDLSNLAIVRALTPEAFAPFAEGDPAEAAERHRAASSRPASTPTCSASSTSASRS